MSRCQNGCSRYYRVRDCRYCVEGGDIEVVTHAKALKWLQGTGTSSINFSEVTKLCDDMYAGRFRERLGLYSISLRNGVVVNGFPVLLAIAITARIYRLRIANHG